ncbi:hypothetical protein [uncultured Algimonas sp.]|uniref:hypothetical protein n=1 Tax=uncultured Algimonas sp. TaxID=1547920 RepID=UPI00260EFCC4|nr:hypothetical protein [uncultured Algimonas sp.]
MRPLYGVFGAVGTWPDWQRFFDLSRAGVVRSFLALLVCFPALWLVMTGLETRRAELAGTAAPDFQVGPFILIVGLWLLSFPVTSALVAILMSQTDRLATWWVARNWALAWLCIALGLVFLAVVFAGLPTIMGYGALLAAYLGLLPIDIRLAQRAGGFPLTTAILVGCVVVSTGMMVLLSGLLQVIQP